MYKSTDPTQEVFLTLGGHANGDAVWQTFRWFPKRIEYFPRLSRAVEEDESVAEVLKLFVRQKGVHLRVGSTKVRRVSLLLRSSKLCVYLEIRSGLLL